MSREQSSTDEAILELLDASWQARDQEIEATAVALLEPDADMEKQASMVSLLGREAVDLTERMTWLYRHPRRLHRLGGSALQLSKVAYSNPTRIITPPLLTTEPEYVASTGVYDGFTFTTFLDNHPRQRQLYMQHVIYDTDRGLSKEDETHSYKILVDHDGGVIERVTVENHDMDAYRFKNEMRATGEYLAFRRAHPKFNPKTGGSPKLTTQHKELTDTLQDAKVGDLPDGFYRFPLGALMRAHDELGRSKRG